MGLGGEQIDVVSFDSYSTLVAIESASTVLEAYVSEPEELARAWHEQAAIYGLIGNAIGVYEDYMQLHRAALAYLLAERGIDATREELEQLNAVYHRLEPYADVKRGLRTVREHGYRVGIISNGNPAMLDSLVETVDIASLVTVAVSAHEIERYKPAVELYQHAADRFGTATESVAHVSNGYFDVLGAMNAGMKGVWLNRQDRQPQHLGPEPHATVTSMDELTELLV